MVAENSNTNSTSRPSPWPPTSSESASDEREFVHNMVNPNRPKGQGKATLEALSTITFEALDGKTKLTIRTRFESVVIRDALLKIGMSEGWSQSLERLATVVTKTAQA